MSLQRVKYLILFVSFLFLVLFVIEMDLDQLLYYLNEVGPNFIWILLVSGLSYLLSSAAWMLIHHKAFGFKHLISFFMFRQIGESFATLNPTGVIGGDALKINLLKERSYSLEEAVQSVSISRILTLLSHIALILFVAVYLLIQFRSHIDLGVLLVSCGLLFIVGYVLWKSFFSPNLLFYEGVKKVNGFLKIKRISNEYDALENFNRKTQKFYSDYPKIFYSSSLLLMLHWVLGAVEYFLILKFLGVHVNIAEAFILEIGTSCVRSVVAFVPGQLGFDEYGNKLFLSVINIAGSGIWIAVSILKRSRQFFWLLFGVVAYFIINQPSLLKISQKIQSYEDRNIIH